MIPTTSTNDHGHIRTKPKKHGRQTQSKGSRALPFVLLLNQSAFVDGYRPPSLTAWSKRIQTGYRRRLAADPSFISKSITEVLVAAGTQLTAEWNRRGADRLLPEIDFVIPGILSAVAGKYYRLVLLSFRLHHPATLMYPLL